MSGKVISRLDKTTSRSKRQPDAFGKFIKNIRQCPCLICGAEAEAAHLRFSDARYKKLNGRDHRWILPLCAGHHRLYPNAQHNSGEFSWWSNMGIDPLPIAKALWDARNDLEAMQKIATDIKEMK
jgi:hypothetical protein